MGLRRTPQREVVLDLVRSCHEHPTAEWIYRHAREAIPDISLATVYRTLRVLKEKGLIWEFSGGANPSRFDGMHDVHEHVRCISCGVVSDLALPEIRSLRCHVSERTGWTIGRWPMVFHGLCPVCAERAREASRANGHAEAVPGAPSVDDDPCAPERRDGPDPESDRDLAEGFW